jgi:hypothetical protein
MGQILAALRRRYALEKMLSIISLLRGIFG